jgi:NADPH-dependent glutamate synthase beta subunit-like oxidoreductase
MPAIPDEVHEAKEEGIEFVLLTAPERIIIRNNRVVALECVRMKLGPADKSGRRKPIPIKGSNFRIKLDTLIPAIGEEVDTSFLPDFLKTEDNGSASLPFSSIPSLSRDKIKVSDNNISTIKKGVFAGGDAVTGPKTIVEALGAGKKAANLIHHYLKKKTLTSAENEKPVAFEDLNMAYFEHQPRVQPAKLVLSERLNSFKEVYRGYNIQQVSQESSRCFSCGVCNKCDNCFVFCPDMSVEKKKGKYEYNYDYCKGCALCVVECPRNAIALVEEKK